MSDIVERLRETYESVVTGTDVLRNPDGPEAADEIERLRAALRDLLRLVEEDPEEDDPSPYLFDQVCDRARAALGEKE